MEILSRNSALPGRGAGSIRTETLEGFKEKLRFQLLNCVAEMKLEWAKQRKEATKREHME